jgi:hypothetical protein
VARYGGRKKVGDRRVPIMSVAMRVFAKTREWFF